MNGRGQNLAGRSAGFIGDDDQGTIVQRIGIAAISEIWLFPAPVDRLHDRPAFDEEPSQGDGFVQRTASVATKIKHQAVDVFLHQAFQQPAHILGAARFMGVHVRIKGGQRDPPQPQGLTVFGRLHQISRRYLVLELHLGSHNGNFLLGGRIIGRHDLQTNGTTFFAADLIDNFLQFEGPHIFHGPVGALGDTNDFVPLLEQSGFVGRSADHDPLDFHGIVFFTQQRANSNE